ncbi:DUF262 domain-containing protein [Spirillospora sp. NPDC046719]
MPDDEARLIAELDQHRRAVDTDYFDLSLRELIRMVEEGEIRIAPAYQRQFRWSNETQSALIESFLLGLPVPAIFVATNRDGTWDVVDGLQRICTVLRFVGVDAPESQIFSFRENPLILEKLQALASYNGTTFADLPLPVRRTFERRYLRIQVLSDKSDPDVRYELFKRLNAGAIALTAQEIRSSIYRGPFNDLIEELAGYQKYRELVKLQQANKSNGTLEELVLKFFAYLDGAEEFNGRVAEFLNAYMRRRMNDSRLDDERKLFTAVVDHLHSITQGAFLRPSVHITPLNQLEAVMVGIGLLLREEVTPVRPGEGWLSDPELLRYSTRATNTKAMLLGRINRAKEIFS